MRIRPLLLAAVAASVGVAVPAAAQAGWSDLDTPELQALTRRFAQASNGPADTLLALFPNQGDFTWVHTVRHPGGRRVRPWRFPVAEARLAMELGPLKDSFGLAVEGQPIGRFVHQVVTRGASGREMRWRRVRGTSRMVLESEPDDSGLFVEWRREGDRWVLAAFGDESYDRMPPPPWCC